MRQKRRSTNTGRKPVPAVAESPLISCLMVSRGNHFPAHLAIECYRRQTYPNRELVIVCAQPNSPVSTLVAVLNDPSIRYVECSARPLGELRNLSVAEARGTLLCTWDDDDLYHPRRLELQAQDLGDDFAADFLSRILIWWPERRLLAITSQRAWENSMLVRREALPRYPSLGFGEDSHVVAKLESRHQTIYSDRPELYCYIIHAENTCDTAHFEQIFEAAEWIYSDYENQLAYFSADYPLKWYSDELAMRTTSNGDGINKEAPAGPLLIHSKKTFGSKDVVVDGIHFDRCTFKGTNLVYRGGRIPLFGNCELQEAQFNFSGSAFNTLNFIRQLKEAGFIGGL